MLAIVGISFVFGHGYRDRLEFFASVLSIFDLDVFDVGILEIAVESTVGHLSAEHLIEVAGIEADLAVFGFSKGLRDKAAGCAHLK